MLTDKQQQIISDLTTEFTKINKPIPTSSGGLINKSLMDKTFNDTIKRKAEITAINKATEKFISDLIDADIDRLNRDLIPMGMMAHRPSDSKDQKIYFGPHNGGNVFYIEYYSNSENEVLPDGSCMTLKKSFGYIRYWYDHSSDLFKSIDDLCKFIHFTKRIQNIYLGLLEQKNK